MVRQFQTQPNIETTAKRWLASQGVSHRLFKKIVTANLLRINGHRSDNRLVGPNDRIQFGIPAQAVITPSLKPIVVVVETADWLILDKPVGLTSVPGPTHPDDSLLNRVVAYLMGQDDDMPQPAIMTRLDRDTQGLVLVAKHAYAQGRLDQIGIVQAVAKTYRAVITGHLDQPSGHIDLPLKPGVDGIHQIVAPDGKAAHTNYRVVASQKNSLVEIALLTGRTHQIRAHFAAIGHPLIGDQLYGGSTDKLSYQALQAATLALQDPFTDGRLKASLPVPEQFLALL